MRLTIIILAPFLLWSCATAENYERLLNSWVGLRESALLAQWGQPQNTVRHPDGSRTHTWLRRGDISVGGGAFTETGTSMRQVDLWCRTSFDVGTTGKIEAAHWSGNNCVAGPRK